MSIGEGQKTKLVLLCILIVVALVVGARSIVRMRGEAARQAQEQSQAAKKAGAPGEAGVIEGQAAGLAVTMAGDRRLRDPFIPQIVPKSASRQGGTETKMVDFALPPAPPGGSMQMFTSLVAAEDPTSELQLTGVIEGAANLAIIRGPEGARYYVREGQRIDGKYTVESISRFGVALRFNGRTFILKLGGKNASEDTARA